MTKSTATKTRGTNRKKASWSSNSTKKPSGKPKETSIFETRTLKEILKDIRDTYLEDHRPWVLGYSGGKDSTATLQLVWQALATIPKAKRKKPVYVLTSDTLVETPLIIDHVTGTLKQIQEASISKGLPFRVTEVYPRIEQSFWVNMIGKGYPAPSSQFRWCTDRLKIQPADRWIKEQLSKSGEIILVLGTRTQESSTRAQSMKLAAIKGSRFRRHAQFPGVQVYTPVADFSTTDIWTYLLESECPWGFDNHQLLAMYQAGEADCPLVVDHYTPSCGNSRFGCWTCTVVEKDRSMEGAIEAGAEWLEPLLEFRNFLASTQTFENKQRYRSHRRRSGQVGYKLTPEERAEVKKTGVTQEQFVEERRKKMTEIEANFEDIVRGPYTLEFRRELLEKLLKVEAEAREMEPDRDLRLIKDAELHEIRRLWREDGGVWGDIVPDIIDRSSDRDIVWQKEDLAHFGADEEALLATLCDEREVPLELVRDLFRVERSYLGMKRRSRIFTKIEESFAKDWRTEEEVLGTYRALTLLQ